MPPEQGLFLDRHLAAASGLCAFTSEVFYAGRLAAAGRARAPGRRRRRRRSPGRACAGSPVAHAGNRERIARGGRRRSRALIDGLLDGGRRRGPTARAARAARRSTTSSSSRRTTPRSRAIAEALPGRARRARSTSSRARRRRSRSTRWRSSSPEDAPRGMEFLYSLNRLNVATSRARCLRGRRGQPGAGPRPLPDAAPDAARERAGAAARVRSALARHSSMPLEAVTR